MVHYREMCISELHLSWPVLVRGVNGTELNRRSRVRVVLLVRILSRSAGFAMRGNTENGGIRCASAAAGRAMGAFACE